MAESFEEFKQRLDQGAAKHEGRDVEADFASTSIEHEGVLEELAKATSYLRSLHVFHRDTQNALKTEQLKPKEIQSEEMIQMLQGITQQLNEKIDEQQAIIDSGLQKNSELEEAIKALEAKMKSDSASKETMAG